KPTSASAAGGSACRLSSLSRKRSSAGAALLMPTQRSFGSRKVNANHCRPTGACPHGSGAAELDEIVAVGAIAVEQHDQLPRSAGAWREPWTVELSGHSCLSCALSAR